MISVFKILFLISIAAADPSPLVELFGAGQVLATPPVYQTQPDLTPQKNESPLLLQNLTAHIHHTNIVKQQAPVVPETPAAPHHEATVVTSRDVKSHVPPPSPPQAKPAAPVVQAPPIVTPPQAETIATRAPAISSAPPVVVVEKAAPPVVVSAPLTTPPQAAPVIHHPPPPPVVNPVVPTPAPVVVNPVVHHPPPPAVVKPVVPTPAPVVVPPPTIPAPAEPAKVSVVRQTPPQIPVQTPAVQKGAAPASPPTPAPQQAPIVEKPSPSHPMVTPAAVPRPVADSVRAPAPAPPAAERATAPIAKASIDPNVGQEETSDSEAASKKLHRGGNTLPVAALETSVKSGGEEESAERNFSQSGNARLLAEDVRIVSADEGWREYSCEAAPWISPWAATASVWNSKLEPYYGPLLKKREMPGLLQGSTQKIVANVQFVTGHPSFAYWVLAAPTRVHEFVRGLADELGPRSLREALVDVYKSIYGEKNWGFVAFLISVWLAIIVIRRSIDIRHTRSAWAMQIKATEKLLEFGNYNLETIRADLKLSMKYTEKAIRDLEFWKEQQEIDNKIEPHDFLHDKRDVRIGRYAGRLVATLMDYHMEYLQSVLSAQFPGIRLPPPPRLRDVVEGMPGPQLLGMPEDLVVPGEPVYAEYQATTHPAPTIFDPYANMASPSKPTQPSESEMVETGSPVVENLMECVDVGLSAVEDALRTLTYKVDLLSHWSAENSLRLGVIDQVILTVMRQLAEVISDVRTTTRATSMKTILDPVWEKMSRIFDDPETATGVTDYLVTLQEERYDYIGRLRAVGEVFARLDDPTTHHTLFHWTESLFKLRVEAPPEEVAVPQPPSEDLDPPTF